MINIEKLKSKKICCEPLENINGYEEAINSEKQYCLHHLLGISMNKSRDELIEMDLYFNRPASELIFMPFDEHTKLHKTGKKLSDEHRLKCGNGFKGRHHTKESKEKISSNLSKSTKGIKKKKYEWIDKDGNIHIMNTSQVKQYHKDWIKKDEL